MACAHASCGFHHGLRGALGARPLALLSALVLGLALGCANGGPPKATPLGEGAGAMAPGGNYRVGPSDDLAITVLPEPAIERKVRVRPDGYFSMDLIGDVEAAGRTPDEIARDIEGRIAEFRVSPSATVAVEKVSSTAVSVLGEVFKPSSFPLERETRLSEAVAMAGGATTLAATSRVRIVRRDGDKTLRYLVNLDRVQAGDATSDYPLQKGDVVYVPAATPVVVGYNIRRILYPLEVLMNTIAGPLIGFAAGGN